MMDGDIDLFENTSKKTNEKKKVLYLVNVRKRR